MSIFCYSLSKDAYEAVKKASEKYQELILKHKEAWFDERAHLAAELKRLEDESKEILEEMHCRKQKWVLIIVYVISVRLEKKLLRLLCENLFLFSVNLKL